MGAAADRWADLLGAWAIPPEILAQAPASPYVYLPEMHDAPAQPTDSPSRALALAALEPGGSVLDVGCGGGAASLALVPPAGTVTGVDESPVMLARFRSGCAERGVEHREVLGWWPDVAEMAGPADVVVCHHVAYNVPKLGPFVEALTKHARRRVVMEITGRHPVTMQAPLWKRFWGIDRPDGPGAADAADVLREVGIDPVVAVAERPPPAWTDVTARVAFTRQRLCLPASRDPEIAEALTELPPGRREVWTFAWDV
jgi:SAM-dependent methyltransferase